MAAGGGETAMKDADDDDKTQVSPNNCNVLSMNSPVLRFFKYLQEEVQAEAPTVTERGVE